MVAQLQKVNMGELKLEKGEGVLAAYGVGSCIIVAMYDREKKVAAMLHAMLPEMAKKSSRENKFADAGIENRFAHPLRDILKTKVFVRCVEDLEQEVCICMCEPHDASPKKIGSE